MIQRKEEAVPMMNTRGEKTLEVLNNLVYNCIEAEESYRKAAENVHDENLKQIFIIHAYQKAEYIAKLKSEIKRLGGKVLNFNYRNNDLNLYYSDDHPTEILNNCETKEAKAIRNYEMAMNDEDLLWEVIPIVSRQYLETQESYNQIKYLKSNYTEAFAHF